jgi:hypothetical protein
MLSLVSRSDADAQEPYVSRRRFDAEVAKKERQVTELRGAIARAEVDASSRLAQLHDLRERNRALEKSMARYKADAEILSVELQRAQSLYTNMHAVLNDNNDDDVSGAAGGAWFQLGAQWGVSQRLQLAHAVDAKAASWRTAGCAVAQLLLDPSLRHATESAFAHAAASVLEGELDVPETEGGDGDGDGDGSRAATLRLGSVVLCEACSGTGLGNTVVSSMRTDMQWMEGRLQELEAEKRKRLPVFVQLVSQTDIGSEVDRQTPRAVSSPRGSGVPEDVDPNVSTDEKNRLWRERRWSSSRAHLDARQKAEQLVENLSSQLTTAKAELALLQVRERFTRRWLPSLL